MALLSGLQTSLTGMKVAQQQMDIVGRNISNVDTVGYSKKSAAQKNVVLAGYSSGVSLGDITRSVDRGLLKSFLSSNSTTGNLEAKNSYLSKAETLLGTPEGSNSLSSNVANLQTSFESFASDVTSATGRYSLVTSAKTLTSRLNSLSQEIQKLRGDADVAISDACNQINTYLDTLAELNNNIVKYKTLGYEGVADLEDQRDQALRDLSNLVDISYFERNNGEIVIQTSSGVTLLDKDPHKFSHSAVAQTSSTATYASGGIGGIYVDGIDITTQIKDGEVKGLIDIRDDSLTSLQAQLDELAGVLKDSINLAHNQGTAYPNAPYQLEGSRDFINPDEQMMKIENGDVRFVIFDSSGKQVATTTLIAGLGMNENGETISDTISLINDWLQSPTGANLPDGRAEIDANGNLNITTGDSNYSFSIRDETSAIPGSEQTNVSISYDVNGDGVYDRSLEGFSNFFGLNDFFVNTKNESVYDSKVLDKNANLGVTQKITLEFGTMSNVNLGSIDIYPNNSLQDIVNKINGDKVLSQDVWASLVPNGNGYVLQINNRSGEQLEINEVPNAGTGNISGFIDRIGLAPSKSGVSTDLEVRSDLLASPNLIAAGSPTFDSSSGQYMLNPATNNIANTMASVFSTSQSFNQTGSLSTTETSLANYASTFVGNIASAANEAEASFNYQNELTNSISTKEAKISGVDMDEELAMLIVFQQSYAACAQTFTASKEMLDTLLNMVR